MGLKEKCEYHPRKRGRRKKRINNLSECSEPVNGEWKSLGRRKIHRMSGLNNRLQYEQIKREPQLPLTTLVRTASAATCAKGRFSKPHQPQQDEEYPG